MTYLIRRAAGLTLALGILQVLAGATAAFAETPTPLQSVTPTPATAATQTGPLTIIGKITPTVLLAGRCQ